MTSEENAIKRVLNGDAASFERFVAEYSKPLFVLARNLLRDPGQARDVVQDTFLAAYANLASFDQRKGDFRAWLYAIARNKCRNARKRIVEPPAETWESIPDSKDVEQECRESELLAKLDQALDKLPHRDRAAFVLAEIQELSLAEVAALENVPVGTVKSRLWRARKTLQELLREYAR